jgi:hypothetical protein
MLRIFTSVKIQRLRSGLNPRPWVPEASMLNTRPPKPSTFMVISRSILLRMRNVSDKSCTENQNTFWFSNFFSKIVPFMR